MEMTPSLVMLQQSQLLTKLMAALVQILSKFMT